MNLFLATPHVIRRIHYWTPLQACRWRRSHAAASPFFAVFPIVFHAGWSIMPETDTPRWGMIFGAAHTSVVWQYKPPTLQLSATNVILRDSHWPRATCVESLSACLRPIALIKARYIAAKDTRPARPGPSDTVFLGYLRELGENLLTYSFFSRERVTYVHAGHNWPLSDLLWILWTVRRHLDKLRSPPIFHDAFGRSLTYIRQ